MATVSLKPYKFPAKDKVENFHGNQVLYVGWEDHLMFCAPLALPLPPATPFKALMEQILPGIYSPHPDFAKVDWAIVEWFKSGQPWKPDVEKSLAENGLVHKDVLRFRTPGLTGIKGTCT
ncbi:MAG: phenol hydroxylase subunit P4 [Panacagrimonas sp.]